MARRRLRPTQGRIEPRAAAWALVLLVVLGALVSAIGGLAGAWTTLTSEARARTSGQTVTVRVETLDPGAGRLRYRLTEPPFRTGTARAGPERLAELAALAPEAPIQVAVDPARPARLYPDLAHTRASARLALGGYAALLLAALLALGWMAQRARRRLRAALAEVGSDEVDWGKDWNEIQDDARIRQAREREAAKPGGGPRSDTDAPGRNRSPGAGPDAG